MKFSKLISYLLVILLFFPSILSAQESKTEKRFLYRETIDDPYKPVAKEDRITSPSYRYRGSNIFTIQVNTDEDGNNILFDAANEPSIGIDPVNPDRIVIGWRQFEDVSSNFRQAGYAYTDDGGETWTSPEPIEPSVFRSDPVIDTDNEGNFYYNSLTKNDNNDYWCDVFRSGNDNFEWDDGTFAQGGDKQWMHIDKTGGIGDGNIYNFWNSSFSICWPGSYTRSIDKGETYEDCDGVMGDPIWGTLTTGPDGELYTVGSASNTGVVVTKSTTAQDPTLQTTWDLATYVDLDGSLSGWQPVNPAGLLGQSYIDCDRSNGPGRGNVYVLASVDRDNGDPADVMFARSTDGGVTWDDPVKVNDDPFGNKWQWFGTMSVAPNGRIDVVWLDTRNSPGTNNFLSELFYSYSIDEGETWSASERISEQFNPHSGWPNQNKMGDYYHMISDNYGAHLAWANTINGEQDVYYSFITPWYVDINEVREQSTLSFINYPNPVINQTTLRYELEETSNVSVVVYDLYGKTVETVVSESQTFGLHNIVYDASNLSKGVYFCKIVAGTKSETIKLTVVD